MRLDALDASILRELVADAWLSFRELAQRVESTTPTVSARVKALEELGVIEAYRAELNPDVLGGPLKLVMVQCSPRAATRIAMALAKNGGVERVDVLAGGRVVAYFRERLHHSVGAPHALLSEDPDVRNYDIVDVLSSPRRNPPTIDEGGVEVPCHQCKGPIHGAPLRARIGDRAHVFCCTHCLDTFRARVTQLQTKPSKASASAHRH